MPKKSDKPRDPTQTIALQVRIKEGLRSKIENAAKEAGRPMNTEIAARLEGSLRDDEQFGGAETRQAMVWLANDIAQIEHITGKSWTSDPTTFEAVKLAAMDGFDRHRPLPDNYEEGQQFIRESNEKFAKRTSLLDTLQECGAVVMRQPNALLAYRDGGTKPYPEFQSEDHWFNPTDTEGAISEADKETIRGWIKEVEDIATGADGGSERIEELMKPIRKAKERGKEIYEEHKLGFEDMIKRALGADNAA